MKPSTPQGLTQKEAAKRLQHHGLNELQKQKKAHGFILFLRQFANIMVVILGVAMLVSAAVGEWIDAFAIGVILIINAIIGFLQEHKAEKAIEALREITSPMALVKRDGSVQKIPAKELVPGDLVILEEGAKIPADGTLVSSTELQTMEAILTGESLPVEKKVKAKVFMGTIVTRGHGEMLITETGMKTELGSIAQMVQEEHREDTPLQKDLNHLSKNLAKIVGVLLFLLLILGLITERKSLEIFLLSISLAVSVIPEGLPAIITLTLALGVERMADQKAVIRRLSAAETLGSTDIICTDKTGTLTKNEMTVQKIFLNGEVEWIEGEGYAPVPSFKTHGREWEKLLNGITLCNNAELVKVNGNWVIQGDPTEGALLTLAAKGGVLKESLEKKHPRRKEWIFDSARKIMSTLNGNIVYTKGAPEEVLKRCRWMEENGRKKVITASEHKKLMDQNADFAKEAYRVLAVAYKPITESKDASEKDLIFIGFVAMMDPPRPEVADALITCKKAHIGVIMITGDNAVTARAIGERIGLMEKDSIVITGEELEKMGHHELTRQLAHVKIFARVSPKHKVQILEALQKNGHIVAMTGDGVNDAPALKKANIGVAMGITGSDVAKEASDMVLLDDNFATIVLAVREGRTIYRNIKKFIRFLLSANFDELLVVSVIFLLGAPLPFLPLQILWVNLLTDALPAVALGLDKADDNLMDLPPRHSKVSIWKDLVTFSALAGILSAGVSLIIYFINIDTVALPYIRTLLLSTIVIFEMGLVFSVRSPDKNFFTGFFRNPFLLFSVVFSLALQLLAVYNPVFQRVLGTMALETKDWILVLELCIGAWLIIEIWKAFQPKKTTV